MDESLVLEAGVLEPFKGLLEWVGGWVGGLGRWRKRRRLECAAVEGWVGWIEEEEAVGMSYCRP